jgi:NAD-dependent DNA ligase
MSPASRLKTEIKCRSSTEWLLPDKPGPNLNKAQKLGVEIIDEAELLRLCGGT